MATITPDKEKHVILPALLALAEAQGGKLDTAGMIAGVTAKLGVSEVPAKLDRMVRNLKSHRTLNRMGLAYVTGKGNRYYKITEKGREFVGMLRAIA